MTFTSLKFIIFFLLVLIAYYRVPKRFQWLVLLFSSYIFYAFASLYYLLVLFAVTLISYLCACKIGKVIDKGLNYLAQNKNSLSRDEKKSYKNKIQKEKKKWVFICIAAELLILAIFKYMDFFFGNAVFLPQSIRNSFADIILPVGLSFYMFQSMGYCIDVYREVYEPERNLLKFALFVSFFPQLLQGPIGDYTKLAPQLIFEREFSYDRVKSGLQRTIWGGD